MKSLHELLESEDQLSEDTFDHLLNYREEDSLIDYKETFNSADEKEWLEITKDIMAFANSRGGYLVFGVQDASFERTGLDTNASRTLTNTDLILQKVNRYLDPPIHQLRSKEFVRETKSFVGLFIPESLNVTHVISKDGNFRYQSGQEKCVLRKGTFYVRRSGGNQLAGTRELDDIFDRRMEFFRDSLLKKIARVVEAPSESEVFILSPERNSAEQKGIFIDDTPEAIPVKGMSFTTAPETSEQEIAGWIALASKDTKAIPPPRTMWKWYEERKTLKLQEKYRIGVAEFCLLSYVPAFYWLQGCSAKSVKQMVLDCLSRQPASDCLGNIVGVAAFLGKRFHQSVLNKLGERTSKLSPYKRKFPPCGPRNLFSPELIKTKRKNLKQSEAAFGKQIEAELESIVTGVREQEMEKPGIGERWQAQIFDCFLYGQDDKYLKGA